jgi:hypothetical protein
MRLRLSHLRNLIREALEGDVQGYKISAYENTSAGAYRIFLSWLPEHIDLSAIISLFDKYLTLVELDREHISIKVNLFGKGRNAPWIAVLWKGEQPLAVVNLDHADFAYYTGKASPRKLSGERLLSARSLDDLPEEDAALIFSWAMQASLE